MPHPPYSHDLILSDFFFVSLDEKSPQGKHFTDMEEVKQKLTEVLKGIKIDKLTNCYEQWKNVSIGVLHQMESTLKVIEF